MLQGLADHLLDVIEQTLHFALVLLLFQRLGFRHSLCLKRHLQVRQLRPHSPGPGPHFVINDLGPLLFGLQHLQRLAELFELLLAGLDILIMATGNPLAINLLLLQLALQLLVLLLEDFNAAG